MESTIFDEDGKLKTGWARTNIRDTQQRLVAELRRQNVRLCDPSSRWNLTDDILNALSSPAYSKKITNILIKADPEGKYQAILLGGEKEFDYQPLGRHISFHVYYLCSVVPRGGVELMTQLKSNLNPPIQSITLDALEEVVGYYRKLGFESIDQSEMIWYPGITGGKRRRKTVRRRKSRRRLTGR